jgi:hypothetical protein
MMSKIDEVFRKVLNDREIFDSPYDKNAKAPIPKLFEGDSWKELERLFNERRKNEFIEKINSRIREIEDQERRANKWRRDKINELKQRAEWLKSAFDGKPHLLKDLFENLRWYGLVECKLPRMEDYGKVIERYDISIVEQYFVDKIKRASYPQNRALKKILEYVKELHTAGISPEEIAYSVRKIDSLTGYWEVIE